LYTNPKTVLSKHTDISRPLQVLYTNCDQLLNKFDELLTIVGNDKPDLILLTEVIPKAHADIANWCFKNFYLRVSFVY